jgi:hypothetical protein
VPIQQSTQQLRASIVELRATAERLTEEACVLMERAAKLEDLISLENSPPKKRPLPMPKRA